jgi:hypothetical protein
MCPHVPQLASSVAKTTQFGPHWVCPVSQPHMPLLQSWLPEQALLQLPQLSGSAERSAQTSPQSVVLASEQTQLPF